MAMEQDDRKAILEAMDAVAAEIIIERWFNQGLPSIPAPR